MKVIIRNGTPEQVGGPFTDNAGTQHPRDILSLWSADELAAIDVHPVVDGPVPDGHVVTGSSLQWDGATVTRVFTSEIAPPPPPDYDAELFAAIDAAATLADLKAALMGSLAGAKARVSSAPK